MTDKRTDDGVVERLADTLALYAAVSDDWRVLRRTATDRGLDWSSLTLGDLRELLACLQAQDADRLVRIYGHGDPEPPAHVAAVLDELGQVWQRVDGKWCHRGVALPWGMLTSIPDFWLVEMALPEHPNPVRTPSSLWPVTP